jgi:hypothetical protein
MWDRYDPRDDERDRGNSWDRSLGGRGSTSDRNWNDERGPRDVFTRNLDLPRGRERRPVRERERVYEIDGSESRTLATIGAFRVAPRPIYTTSGTAPRPRGDASSTLRRKG